MLYRLLLGFDFAIAAVALFFFVWGLGDGTVSSVNIAPWLGLILAIGGVLAGGFMLQANGNRAASILVLLVLAIPAVLFVLFFLLILAVQPRWN